MALESSWGVKKICREIDNVAEKIAKLQVQCSLMDINNDYIDELVEAVGALDEEDGRLRAWVDDQEYLTRLYMSHSMEVGLEYQDDEIMETDDAMTLWSGCGRAEGHAGGGRGDWHGDGQDVQPAR